MKIARNKITRTIRILKARYTTSLHMAVQGGCMALSQRVGELRKEGYVIGEKWVVSGSSRVKAWKILREPKVCV